MPRRLAFLCAVVSTFVLLPRALAAEPSAAELTLEVNALRILHFFKTTPEQLKSLRKLAPQTMNKPGAHKATAAKDYVGLLTELRDALAEEKDDDLIDSLDDRLDQLRETNPPDLQDGYEITQPARAKVAAVLKLFKPSQVANYIAMIADEVIDPLEHITEAFDKVRLLKADEAKEQIESVADEVGRLVGGLDERADKVTEQVQELLEKVRAMKVDEFESQRATLQKKAGQIVGDLQPTDVIRHKIEYVLAELLSNPCLQTALDARLK